MESFRILSVIGSYVTNLYQPIKIIQKEFKIAKNKTNDAQGKNFERRSRLIQNMDDPGTGEELYYMWERTELREQGTMQMFEAKSQNAQFEFSTNYLHFILKKAA